MLILFYQTIIILYHEIGIAVDSCGVFMQNWSSGYQAVDFERVFENQ